MTDRPLMQLLDSPAYPLPSAPRDWRRWIRRIRFGSPALRAVAGVLSDVADYSTGDGITIGIPRLARASETDPKTVRAALKRLRDLLLLERTHEGGSGQAGDTDRYRLTVPSSLEWLLERVQILDPDEQQLMTGPLLPAQPGGLTPPGQTGRNQTVSAVETAEPGGVTPPAQSGTRRHQAKLPASNRGASVPRPGGVSSQTGGRETPQPLNDTSQRPTSAILSSVPPELEDEDHNAAAVDNTQIAAGRSPPLAPAPRRATG